MQQSKHLDSSYAWVRCFHYELYKGEDSEDSSVEESLADPTASSMTLSKRKRPKSKEK